jgi:uncharacterized membrane protein
MMPNPLHPAIVHFPIVLAVLLPVFVAVAIWAIRRGANPVRIWSIPLALAALLVASSFVALKTGEAEEERVESVVSEAVLHEHEEAAERFLALGGVLLLIAAAGLVHGRLGSSARLLTAAGSVALLVAGFQVGDAGGQLVYRYNAGSVYAEGTGAAPVLRAGEDDD